MQHSKYETFGVPVVTHYPIISVIRIVIYKQQVEQKTSVCRAE